MKDFVTYIKQYSTENIIYFFSQISIQIYKGQIKAEDPEALTSAYTTTISILEHGFLHRNVPVSLYAWEVPDIAYTSIINANDYRKKNISEKELGTIINLYRGYENDKSSGNCLVKKDLSGIFKVLLGMTFEQFKYDKLKWSIENFNRNYHLLIESPNVYRDKIISVGEVTQKIFGLEVDELLQIEILLLWLCHQDAIPLEAPEEIYHRKEDSVLTKENIKKVIEYYSTTYEEVRNSKVGKQIFYNKPFINTPKEDKYIMVSVYLLHMLFADGLYWLMRDYYLKYENNLVFINTFGEMFEDYFQEIASIYLEKENWYKIPENKIKSADFYMEFENAVLLFELKSGLMGIGAKQQVPNIEEVEKFYKRNILEAYDQLQSSQNNYKGIKPVLKIFLLYENFNNAQLIMSSIPEIFDVDDRCYIMSIQDLEMFLSTYKSDMNKFNRVLKSMLYNKDEKPHYKSVLHILESHKATLNLQFSGENNYLSKLLDKLQIEFN